jgi:branched-chain amino acid transport system permease protein
MSRMDDGDNYDWDAVYRQRYDGFRRRFLKTVVTPEVIEEHRCSPNGQHSEPLERLLIYFRTQPLEGKYAVRVVEQFKDYRIVALSERSGVAQRTVDDTVYHSAKEAYHGLFLRCIQDLLDS